MRWGYEEIETAKRIPLDEAGTRVLAPIRTPMMRLASRFLS